MCLSKEKNYFILLILILRDDYNLRMVKLWEETSLKKQSLEAEIALFNSKLKLLKEANLANEKDLRMKRRKAEERCLRAIKKYDDDISEQHEIMCELIEELNLVTKEEDELKVLYLYLLFYFLEFI